MRLALVLAVIVGLLCPPRAAEADQLVSVSGQIVDVRTGVPIPGAKISALSPSDERSVVSSTGGFFSLLGLPAGRTLVAVEALGYAPSTCAYRLEPGDATRLRFVLEKAYMTRSRPLAALDCPRPLPPTQDTYFLD